MASNKLTLIAELKDRLTGPAKKAAKAVEDLGRESEKSAIKSEKAAQRAERAEAKRSRTTQRTAQLAGQAEGRRAKAAEGAARRAEQASQKSERSDKRRATSTEKATARQDKAFGASAIAAERARRNYEQATTATSKSTRGMGRSAEQAGQDMRKMAGVSEASSKRTTDVIGQMANRSTSGIGLLSKSVNNFRPDGMATRFNDALSRMLGRTEQVAGQIKSSLGSVADSSFVNYGAMGATAVGGLAAAGGLRRIADVQQADVVMETMGIDQRGRENLMDQFKGLAQDTPFSTGSIAALGSGLISSGMDQSKVEPALQGAIDTAALFGMSMEEIALPLKQMQAKGILQGDDLNQLMDRNIPMMDWIAKQKGVDRSEVKDMVSEGQVTADDVFAAMAANSEGGAEKAAGTLKGSWTNFLSSISQLGEAFLTPMVGDLTEALQVAKESVAGMKPQLTVLGKFVGALVKGLAPFLPVIVPGLVALGAALVGLKVASTAATGIQALAQGGQWLSQRFGGAGGATRGMAGFGRETRFVQSDVRSLAGQGGLGRLDQRLGTVNKTMGRGDRAARGLAKGFGIAAGAAIGLMAATKGMEALGKINADLDPAGAGNSIKTGGDINKEFAGKDWANHQGSIFGGTMSGVSGIGDVIHKQQNQSVGDKVVGFFGDGKFFGYKDGWQKGFDSLSEQDTALAGMAGSPEAGARWNAILSDARRAGSDESQTLAAFPEYRSAVTERLTEKGMKADDSTLLQFMGNTAGFRSGGYTGDGNPAAPAGVVHRKEFVFNAARTAQIGVENLRAVHAGRAPAAVLAGGAQNTTHVNVNVDARGATPEAAAAVGTSVEAAVERVLARRERRGRNTHGTRSRKGAH